MRNAAVLLIGLALLLVQGNLFRLLGPWGFAGATPNLVLPIILFLGVFEGSMARAALLSFTLGYLTDLFASAPIGLFTFSSVAAWWLCRVAAVRLSAQTVPAQLFLAFLFSWVEAAIVLTVLTIFGRDPQRPLEIARTLMPHSLLTAVCSPLVFRWMARLHQQIGVSGRSTEHSF